MHRIKNANIHLLQGENFIIHFFGRYNLPTLKYSLVPLGSVWGARGALGQVRGLQARHLQRLVGRPPDGVPLMPSESPGSVLPAPTPSQVAQDPSVFWLGQNEGGLFGSIPHGWGSWWLTRTLHFPLGETAWAEKVLWALSPAALGEGWSR